MDATSLQQQQEIMASQSLDSMLVCTKAQSQAAQQQQEKKPRPPEEALKCPRCDSSNTKFCYYNNYSLSQPRYFCKSCRRYWTKGGTLRNVPVGGGCRKHKRTSSSSSRRTNPDHHQPHLITTTPNTPSVSSFSPYDHHHPSPNDLALAFARLHRQVGGSMGFDSHDNQGNVALLGNLNNPHFDLFGNSLLESQSNVGFQDLYYGLGSSGSLGIENGGGNSVNISSHEDHHLQMGMQFDPYHGNNQEMMSNPSSGSSTPTAIKQEVGQNRVLLGLPWQLSIGEGSYMNGGESWNTGVLGSSMHSLLNSPLM